MRPQKTHRRWLSAQAVIAQRESRNAESGEEGGFLVGCNLAELRAKNLNGCVGGCPFFLVAATPNPGRHTQSSDWCSAHGRPPTMPQNIPTQAFLTQFSSIAVMEIMSAMFKLGRQPRCQVVRHCVLQNYDGEWGWLYRVWKERRRGSFLEKILNFHLKIY